MNNMIIAKEYVEAELNRCQSMHYKFAKQLSRISTSTHTEVLSYSERNGRKYYTEIRRIEGKRKHKYIGTEENPDVKLIKEKHFLPKAIKMLEDHAAALASCEDDLAHFDFVKVNQSLPNAYRLTNDHLAEIVGLDEERRWYTSDLNKKKVLDEKYGFRFPNNRRHVAADGTIMRSKSEISIANEFIKRGKPYIYEMPLEIGHRLLHPDFTFYSNRFMKVIRWEHIGMLGNNGYMEDLSERIDLYVREGYVPCVDVIFSFDTKTGNLDTRLIKKLLDEYQ